MRFLGIFSWYKDKRLYAVIAVSVFHIKINQARPPEKDSSVLPILLTKDKSIFTTILALSGEKGREETDTIQTSDTIQQAGRNLKNTN